LPCPIISWGFDRYLAHGCVCRHLDPLGRSGRRERLQVSSSLFGMQRVRKRSLTFSILDIHELRFKYHREFSICKSASNKLGRVIAERCDPRVTRLQCDTAGECRHNHLIADLVQSPVDLRD